MLAAALVFFAKLCRLCGAPKIAFCGVVLFLYAGICGFSPSSVRAFVMAMVFLTAKESGMKYDALSSLAFSAIIVLFFFPMQFFSVGFRLSYSVVFAILLLSKRIARVFAFLPDKISSATGTVVAAQIGSLPVSLYYFGVVSPVSVIVNLLAIPLVSALFVSLFVGVVVGALFDIPVIALFLQKYALRVLVGAIMIFDYEKLLVYGIAFGVFTIFYYFLILLLSDKINLKKKTLRFLAVVFSSFFFGGTAVLTDINKRSIKICVASDSAANSLCVLQGEKAYLILSGGKGGSSIYNVRRFLEREKISSLDLIVLNGDAYVFANAFVSLVENVWYTGENGPFADELFGIRFYVFSPEEKLVADIGAFYLGSDGVTLVYVTGDSRIMVCAEKSEISAYRGSYDLLVAPRFPDTAEELRISSFALFGPSEDYPNYYKEGNLLYKIVSGAIKRI